jgi:hypothetical protein
MLPTPIIRGQEEGRLTPLEQLDPDPKTGATRWRCLCTCGREAIRTGPRLHHGATRSCGCLHRETAIKNIQHFNRWKSRALNRDFRSVNSNVEDDHHA